MRKYKDAIFFESNNLSLFITTVKFTLNINKTMM